MNERAPWTHLLPCLFLLLSVATACAGSPVTSGQGVQGPGAPGATDAMTYGGGDGTSCSQAIVINEKSEAAGIAAEYTWLATRYPDYERRYQALTTCLDHRADEIAITTADGRQLSFFFDISKFFGKH